MVKWVEEIVVTQNSSTNFYHYNDNRILPPGIDAERAEAEGWWMKPEYIFNELNINSVISSPGHNEVIVLSKEDLPYKIRGYVYTGGGRKITRAEVSLDNGVTWLNATIIRTEIPNDFGKYWCWVFFELQVVPSKLSGSVQLMCRAFDESNNTQPNHITWNLMGMGNNCVFRVKVTKQIVSTCNGEVVQLHCEHPTQPGKQTGGWMGSEADGWQDKQRGDRDMTRPENFALEA